METHPVQLARGTVVGRTILDAGQPVQIADALVDPEFTLHEDSTGSGVRTLLGIPLLREGSPIGVIGICRQDVTAFTDKQIELLHDLRRPGGDRDRERAAVRRGAEAHRGPDRIAAAADRHRRCAQGHQPLDLRPADCLRHAGGSSAAGCARPTRRSSSAYDGDRCGWSRLTASRPEFDRIHAQHPIRAGRGQRHRRARAGTATTVHIPDVLADPDYT